MAGDSALTTERDHPTLPVRKPLVAFRVLLWMLPAAFLVYSVALVSWVNSLSLPFSPGFKSWLILNFLFIICTGWFDSLLALGSSAPFSRFRWPLIRFFLIQLLIFALIAGVLIVAAVIGLMNGNPIGIKC